MEAMSLDEPTGSSEVIVTKPPPMRKKPQQRWIGPGKRYATRAQFDADLAKWVEEHEARKLLVKKWDKYGTSSKIGSAIGCSKVARSIGGSTDRPSRSEIWLAVNVSVRRTTSD